MGYLEKHIPGKPSITVQNMPGAGSVIAANYIYTVAKPDGLTLTKEVTTQPPEVLARLKKLLGE